MRDYLIALVLFPALAIAWVVVQNITRRFALKHPEFGPPREEGGGCGGSCCKTSCHFPQPPRDT